jgi:hypothetical protein
MEKRLKNPYRRFLKSRFPLLSGEAGDTLRKTKNPRRKKGQYTRRKMMVKCRLSQKLPKQKIPRKLRRNKTTKMRRLKTKKLRI